MMGVGATLQSPDYGTGTQVTQDGYSTAPLSTAQQRYTAQSVRWRQHSGHTVRNREGRERETINSI